MYKQGLQLGLRFTTSVGLLTIEQLFQLKQNQLENAIRNQKKLLKASDDDELGFLDVSSKVDPVEQLKFDILKDVYITKKAEAEAIRESKAKKENNQKILELIAQKKEGVLQEKSIEELEKMLID